MIELPHPKLPGHVDNLSTIPLLKAQGFEGCDADIEESLFQYGLIWREYTEEDGSTHFLFVHKHPTLPNRYDRSSYRSDTDVYKEWNWADYENMFATAGITKEEFDKMPFPQKVGELYNHYGPEAIFGSSYWEGFAIKTNTETNIPELNQKEVTIVEDILLLLNRCNSLFNRLSQKAQQEILNIHSEDKSLNHALRWGTKAAEEITAACKENGILPNRAKAEMLEEVIYSSGAGEQNEEPISLFRDPESQGIFAVDASYLEQTGSDDPLEEPAVLPSPFNPGFLEIPLD